MDATSASLENASHAGASHTIQLAPSEYSCRKRLFALTLEQDAYHSWKLVHQYMCSRKQPCYTLVCEHDGPEYQHIHALYQYDNVKLFSTKNLPLGVHVEEHVFSPQKYAAYCKAEDDKHKSLGVNSCILIETGELKQAGGCRSVKALREADIEDIDPHLYRIKREIDEKERREQSFFNMLDEIDHDELKAPDVYYISGIPGAGKTYGAYKLAMSMYEKKDIGRIKFCNQFAVIDNEKAKCFVIEEFRPSDLRASELLQLMDKYGTNVNVKGGFVYLRPKCLIICSFNPPDELYQKDELTEQFMRRITKHYIADGHKLL